MLRAMADTGNANLQSEIQDACHKKQAFCFGAPDGQQVIKPMEKDGVSYAPEVQHLPRLSRGHRAEFHTMFKGFIRLARRPGFERMPMTGTGSWCFVSGSDVFPATSCCGFSFPE